MAASTTWGSMWDNGLAASRPAASAVIAEAYYFATDTGVLSQSDGVSTWTDVETFQPGEATLTALAALASTTGLLTQTATDTFTTRNIAAATGLAVTNPAGVAGNPTIAYDINALSADASPDSAADYVVTYDASASAHKKVLLDDLPGGGGGVADHDHTTGGDGGDLDSPVIDGYAVFNEESAPSAASSGTVRVYAKSDGRIYSKDDGGTEYGPFDAAGGGAGTHAFVNIAAGSFVASGSPAYASMSGSVTAGTTDVAVVFCTVSAGTGTNGLAIRVNGTNTGGVTITGLGRWYCRVSVTAGDTIEPVNTNSAGNGMTITDGGWFYPA